MFRRQHITLVPHETRTRSESDESLEHRYSSFTLKQRAMDYSKKITKKFLYANNDNSNEARSKKENLLLARMGHWPYQDQKAELRDKLFKSAQANSQSSRNNFSLPSRDDDHI